jgi:hypothetical protein
VRNHKNVACRSHGRDTASFGQAADPRHVGLKDVGALAVNELTKAVASVLVLSRRHEAHARQRLLHLGIAIVVVLVDRVGIVASVRGARDCIW